MPLPRLLPREDREDANQAPPNAPSPATSSEEAPSPLTRRGPTEPPPSPSGATRPVNDEQRLRVQVLDPEGRPLPALVLSLGLGSAGPTADRGVRTEGNGEGRNAEGLLSVVPERKPCDSLGRPEFAELPPGQESLVVLDSPSGGQGRVLGKGHVRLVTGDRDVEVGIDLGAERANSGRK